MAGGTYLRRFRILVLCPFIYILSWALFTTPSPLLDFFHAYSFTYGDNHPNRCIVSRVLIPIQAIPFVSMVIHSPIVIMVTYLHRMSTYEVPIE